jgi:hypothetical protein
MTTDLTTDITSEPTGAPTSDEAVTIGEPVTAAEQLVEVRRRPGPAAAVGAGSSLVAVAYLARAAGGGGALDWVLGVVLGLIGVANLAALVDARTPLLVADELGVRLRLGRTWVGLPWGGMHEVEHRARSAWWRDGLLTVHTHYVQRVLEDLDPGARRIAALNRRLHGSPLVVPLGLGTRAVGAHPSLTAALRDLADQRTPVVDTAPEVALTVQDDPDDSPRPRRLPDPRPAIAHVIGLAAARWQRPQREVVDTAHDVEVVDPSMDAPELEASATPPPAREPVAAVRAEVRHESRAVLEGALGDDTQAWEALHAVDEVEDAVIVDDDVASLVAEPVIGPQFAAARERLGLSVDELADRTRIRPHVIEAIEVDDFSACGGDFYARGHLRTLGRVLGVESTPILAAYDDRYADAPIDPRRVFEAELAGAGSIRATRGGPNWSVLVAAVMALVLCWSVARLVTGGPGRSPDEAVLSGSGGPNHSRSVLTPPVPVTLTAAGGGARVVVRDGLGKLVFSGDLSYGQKHTLRASVPVHIQSTDGSVQVTVDGQDRGRMGLAGRPASKTYRAHR